MNGTNFSEMPWWVGILIALISAFGSFLATRSSSKSKAESELVKQAVERQKQLDTRQNGMMKDFVSEIARLKDELLEVRKELSTEREWHKKLEDSIDGVKDENEELRKENEQLRQEVDEIKKENEELRKENIALRKQVDELKAALIKFENGIKN